MLILWKRIVFVLRKPWTQKKVSQLAEIGKTALLKGEEGIDQNYIHGPEAESALKLADAASKLITSLNGTDQAIIRTGPLLLVKITQDGKSKLAVETVSTRLRRILDENPKLLDSPLLLFSELQKLKAPVRELPPIRGRIEEPRA